MKGFRVRVRVRVRVSEPSFPMCISPRLQGVEQYASVKMSFETQSLD